MCLVTLQLALLSLPVLVVVARLSGRPFYYRKWDRSWFVSFFCFFLKPQRDRKLSSPRLRRKRPLGLFSTSSVLWRPSESCCSLNSSFSSSSPLRPDLNKELDAVFIKSQPNYRNIIWASWWPSGWDAGRVTSGLIQRQKGSCAF